MKVRLLVLCFIICIFPQLALTKPLIADLSDYDIRIDASFSGTSLLLFGARNDPGDVIIIVRGPQKKFMIQKKERILGIWMNTKRAIYPTLPDFLSIATSKPLDQIHDYGTFKALHIGFDTIPFIASGDIGEGTNHSFQKAIIDYQIERNLYALKVDSATFMGETLFKTRIHFPDNIPRGTYTAEVYLILDGVIAGMQSIPIIVTKTGVDALIYDFAHQKPALYGIVCIFIALGLGMSGHYIFRRH